jgi:hypothetical protein
MQALQILRHSLEWTANQISLSIYLHVCGLRIHPLGLQFNAYFGILGREGVP